ncbi:MAG: hypothetical protein APF81_24515 [Desulfosporosinus sp. BRH_c37]|nr:MAG: hypothetical protein APF81_24515 [Desulfosporosinus sp. BRH_c37]
MHYSAPVYRPPGEANSILLEVTVGCTHNKCEFCYVYKDISFSVSPMEQIEKDLKVASLRFPENKRIYLVGGNPFVLPFEKLKNIAVMINKYLPKCEVITTFARISDIKNKTVVQLKELKKLGISFIYVGTESGNDEALRFMKKGITAADSVEQLKKLEEAGIRYFAMYLAGLGGHRNGEKSAIETAKMFNQLSPRGIGIMSLTIYDNAPLKKMVENGEFVQATELELIKEIAVFIKNLNISTTVTTQHIVSLIPFKVKFPEDKEQIMGRLMDFLENTSEEQISQNFDRKNIRSI